MAEVLDQTPQLSSSQYQAQFNADFGPESSQETRARMHDEQERIENAKIDFIRSKTMEIESSSTPPTYKEVADLFKELQPNKYDWQSTFTMDHKNMAPAYYQLADIIIEKWKAKESMSDEEALWITRQLNLSFIDNRSIGRHKQLFEDAKFRKQIIDAIANQQRVHRDAFKDLLRNIKMLVPAAPAAAAAAAPAAAAPAVDPHLEMLMATIQAQMDAGKMTEKVYIDSLNALRDLHGKLKKGGYRRRTKHSKKHSKKSRKSKSRRH